MMTFLLFTVALSLSAVAAYYAIFGLMAIFAGATIPIAIMGGLLECSKLTVASWLYQNWKEIPKLFKTYFLIALIILMMLTSMGIFGYLSKAHLDQAVPTGDIQAKLSLIEEKLAVEKGNIDAARKQISQMDSINDQTINRTNDAKGVERANQIRQSQQKERTRLLAEIGKTQERIAKLNEEKAPIASQVRKVEAEVGPIKYIAALIYGDTINTTLLEKAVRIVIIMIVAVFDPLAVLLLVAANWNLKNFRSKNKPLKVEEKSDLFFGREGFLEKGNPPFPVMKQDPIVKENISIPDPSPEPLISQPEISNSELEDSPLKLEIDEPTKDWEPELYTNQKELGRYLEETQGIQPSKTKSFLKKIQSLYKEPIEKQVDDLQSSNT